MLQIEESEPGYQKHIFGQPKKQALTSRSTITMDEFGTATVCCNIHLRVIMICEIGFEIDGNTKGQAVLGPLIRPMEPLCFQPLSEWQPIDSGLLSEENIPRDFGCFIHIPRCLLVSATSL